MHPVSEVAILGDPADPGTSALLDALWETYRPYALAAISTYPPPLNSPQLLDERPLLDNLPTAYVCRNFVCNQPVNSPEKLREQLGLG
jgi:hypothetical protein